MRQLRGHTHRNGILALVAMFLLFGFQVGLLHHASAHHVCHVDDQSPTESRCSLCQTASHYALEAPDSPELATWELNVALEPGHDRGLYSADVNSRRARAPPLKNIS